ncbi:hypothetical protein [Streptomyces spiralis]|uniref:hypothetical protein n=1 Tax=Streptomyces spiralis TaxID=66376 RepID=UPI00167BA7E9|nr:hypothetical protein [Streptomyces spiralis]
MVFAALVIGEGATGVVAKLFEEDVDLFPEADPVVFEWVLAPQPLIQRPATAAFVGL